MIGNIYKIIHNQSNIVYIGSTFDTLRNRWQGHKDKFKKGENFSIYPYFKQYGIENFKIILIKQYDVIDRKHLLMYEQLWMNKMKNCINKQKAFQPLIKEEKRITDKVYYEVNKDKIKEKIKEYYEIKKDKISEYQKEYYEVNKKKVDKRNKEYRENNKDKIKIKKNEKFNCECGSSVSNSNKSAHFKSKKHLNFIAN